MELKGVILHGGHGTRLRPLTHTGPKQLIPVANKPISQYVLEDLIEAGVKDIVIVLGDLYPERVTEYYGNGTGLNTKIHYVYQDAPKGIAHAINICREYLGEQPFVVYLGDNLLKGGITDFTEMFRNSSYDAMILLCEVENPQRFGVAQFENGKLTALVEKPKQPPSNYALTGIYFFRPVVFEMIDCLKPSWRDELEITEALQMLLERGYKVGYRFVRGWWKDTGTPEDILEANRLILDELQPVINGVVEATLSIQGRVSLGSNSVVKKGALIRGPSIIGNDTTIEGQVYIGPYTSIGNNTTISRGEVENSVIMDHCLIDINERITDSLIAPYTKISEGNNKPQGYRFVLGERSYVEF